MHARTFLCREALWQTFEEIAREQGAPIDEVLSEAMRSYARQRSQPADGRAHDYEAENAPDLARTNARAAAQRPNGPSPSINRPAYPQIAPPPVSRSGSTMGMPLPPPPQRGAGQRPYAQPLAPVGPPSRRGGPMPPPPPPPSVRPPPMGARPAPAPTNAGARAGYAEPMPPAPSFVNTSPNARNNAFAAPRARSHESRLSLSYDGQHVDVTKDRFILGRSKTQADLVVEDPNVSRQHAAIERMGSEWILVDLGSTNGCYVDGQRVSRRPIADGDIIEITTHQVHCTLR